MDGSVLHELRIGRRTSLLLVAEGGDRPRRLDKHRGHASATVYGAAAPAARAATAATIRHERRGAPRGNRQRRLRRRHTPGERPIPAAGAACRRLLQLHPDGKGLLQVESEPEGALEAAKAGDDLVAQPGGDVVSLVRAHSRLPSSPAATSLLRLLLLLLLLTSGRRCCCWPWRS